MLPFTVFKFHTCLLQTRQLIRFSFSQHFSFSRIEASLKLKNDVPFATSRRMGEISKSCVFSGPLCIWICSSCMNCSWKKISFNNRFWNSTEDTLKDACLYVLTTLEEGKTIWGKDILYVIYRYFQITHPIIKNKFSELINDKVWQRSIIILMCACSVVSDSLQLHGL